jgi:hypothetical protein
MDLDTTDLLKQQYQFGEWVGRRTTPFGLFIHGLFVPSTVLSEWYAAHSRRLVQPNRPIYIRTLWAANESAREPSLVTEIYECDSMLTAHETLLALTAGFQVPMLKLGADAEGLGDIWLQAANDSCMLFARANLVVVISPLQSVGSAVIQSAERIDMFIKDRPAAETLSADSSRLTAPTETKTLKAPIGRHTTLDIPGIQTDRASDAVCVKIFYDKGQVFREANDVVFDPETSGDANIDMYELNPDGAVRNRAVNVHVE